MMWHIHTQPPCVSVHGSYINPFTKQWNIFRKKVNSTAITVWRFRKKKKGTRRRGGQLKNSLLQDILWSFSGWLTENLISSWACNCRSFCSMSAIADLINKVLWQCTVYFQGLDLRAEAQGWDTVYPTYTHTGTLTQHTVQYGCAHRHAHMHDERSSC